MGSSSSFSSDLSTKNARHGCSSSAPKMCSKTCRLCSTTLRTFLMPAADSAVNLRAFLPSEKRNLPASRRRLLASIACLKTTGQPTHDVLLRLGVPEFGFELLRELAQLLVELVVHDVELLDHQVVHFDELLQLGRFLERDQLDALLLDEVKGLDVHQVDFDFAPPALGLQRVFARRTLGLRVAVEQQVFGAGHDVNVDVLGRRLRHQEKGALGLRARSQNLLLGRAQHQLLGPRHVRLVLQAELAVAVVSPYEELLPVHCRRDRVLFPAVDHRELARDAAYAPVATEHWLGCLFSRRPRSHGATGHRT